MASKLSPEDLAELRELSSRLEGDLDALSSVQRSSLMKRLRKGMDAPFSAEDERISSLWIEGKVGVVEILKQFGERIGHLGNTGNAI